MKNSQSNFSLTPAHWEEIVEGSGVSEAIATLNFISTEDSSEVDQLLNRNNNRRWKHWQHGPGWAVSGIDPQTTERTLLGVQFKPDTPVQKGTKKDGTPDHQKYFGATDYPAEPLFLEMPEGDYWQKVLENPHIPVIITEGAKKAGAALTAGIAAISLPGVTCGQKLEELKARLKPFCGLGRTVYLGFDSEPEKPQVMQALNTLGCLIFAEGAPVKVLQWDAKWKGLDDYLVAHGHEAIAPLIQQAVTFAAWRKTTEQAKEKQKPERKTAADSLLTLAKQVSYFHTSDKVAYADIWIEGNRHTYVVRSKAFRLWLQGQYYESHDKGIGAQTLQDTLGTLEAIAIFQGETHEVNLRTAEHQGKTYLDLGTPDWKAVEIDATGWRLVSDPPVRFWRPDSLLPLPYPVEGGTLDELRQLLNVDGAAWTLIITFLLFCYQPKHHKPILILHGEQGSGKTTVAEFLKSLIDPGKAGLLPAISDAHRMAVAASRRWMLAYDNLSGINAEQSDALCRISTGGGFSTRTLYSDDQETCFEFTRPQILTGIDSLATRGDLLQRSLMVSLPSITPDRRKTREALEAQLNEVRPRILGAILTALSQTLKALPDTNPANLPRMADFGRFAIAAETALGLKQGDFVGAFDDNREEAHEIVLESSPVAQAIQRFMEGRTVWQGTASELLVDLEPLTPEKTTRSRQWPGNSRSLGKALTRLAPDLRGLGIDVEFERTNNSRRIVLEKVAVKTSQTSLMSQLNQDKDCSRDVSVTRECSVTRETSLMSPNVTPNVTAETQSQQGFEPLTDMSDMSDIKNTPDSKWCLWTKINTQVEVLEHRGDRTRIRVPGEPRSRWVSTSELKESAA